MTQTPYSITLKRFCEISLIHLYISVSDNARQNKFTPTHTRNKILVDFIKIKFNAPEFKGIKKEMKRFIKMPKEAVIENALHKLLDTVLPKVGKSEAEMEFIDFLSYLHKKTGLMVDFEQKGTSVYRNHIYLVQDEFFSCVSNDGTYKKPVSIKIFSDEPSIALKAIADYGRFLFDINEEGPGFVFLNVTAAEKQVSAA